MSQPSPQAWDPRKEKELRQVLAELKAMEEAGAFDGLEGLGESPPAKHDTLREAVRGRQVAKRIALAQGLDSPVGPALSQYMSQLAVKDRTQAYKEENRKHFDDARNQVKYLYGRIARGEVASHSLVRAIVGSLLDTFMKDRNLLVNLAAHPFTGEDYLYDHSLKLCLLSLSLASTAGYGRNQAIEIAQGALLADAGMMLVPERIRNKRGKLTQSEIFEMQKHPILGLALLEPIHGLSDATLLIPFQHHERISGSGYPDQRSGSQVSRFSRIVGIADVFTALINKRSYREALLPYNAMVAILSMGGQGLLDGDHIRNFLRTLSIFPIGSLVRLSSGCIAKVVSPNPTEFTKPVVSLLTSEHGNPLPPSGIRQVDLSLVFGETIVEALPDSTLHGSIIDGF